MSSEHKTPPVDLEPLFGYWETLIGCSSAEEQLIAADKLRQQLDNLGSYSETFQNVIERQRYEHYRRGALGFYVEGAFPEDNLPASWGKHTKRRFLASFTIEQEPEMYRLMEAWLNKHYPNSWRREKSSAEPHYTVKDGNFEFQAFATWEIKEGYSNYDLWQHGFTLMAELP